VRLLAGVLAPHEDERRRLLAAALAGFNSTRAGEPPTGLAPANVASEPTQGTDAISTSLDAAPALPTPRELPADVTRFTGRAEELKALDELLSDEPSPAAAVVSVIAGSAGVGKTALAVHWAHRVRDWFPDGQLYADLRGFAADPPLRPVQVLAQFLRALGIRPERVPVDVDEAAAMYRSLLAERRVLVVLDNAASVDDVRPLLPGGARCRALVTSRNRLGGLVARDGAEQLTLDVLRPDESYALLAGLLGRQRVAAEPDAVAALAQLCDHLPLALRIAAANLTAGPHRTIDAYRAGLARGDRLTALAVAGDDQSAVRATFDLSYARLRAPARRMFRLLGLVPGPDLTPEAAAALAGTGPAPAQVLVQELLAAHLIDEPVPDRYALHDLIRLFAAELAEREETGPDRVAARTRLFQWYLRRVDAAARVLYPDLGRLATPALPVSGAPDPDFDTATASAWLDAERPNLVATVVHLSRHEGSELAWLLADALRGYFYLRSDPADWLTVAQAGLAAAEATGSELGQGAARLSLATFHWHHNRYRQSIAEAERALPLVRRAGWDRGELSVLNDLANSCAQSGHLDQAIGHLQQALALDQRTGLRAEANLLGNLAAACGQRGDLAKVIAHATRAISISRRGGRPLSEAALRSLGDAQHLLGRFRLAARHHSRGRELSRQMGNPAGEVHALRGLAAIHRDLGAHQPAMEHITLALSLLGTGGHPLFEAECLAVRASIDCAGDPDAALDTYQQAWRLAHTSHNRYPEVESLVGLATAHLRKGEYEPALGYAERALGITRQAGFRLLEGQALAALAAIRLARDGAGPAIDLGQQALLAHQQTGHRLGEARVHTLLADARERAGDQAAAATHRSAARTLFSEIGAELPEELRELAGGPSVTVH
jgi:tetratricopeptide (TPR) repeat protein